MSAAARELLSLSSADENVAAEADAAAAATEDASIEATARVTISHVPSTFQLSNKAVWSVDISACNSLQER